MLKTRHFAFTTVLFSLALANGLSADETGPKRRYPVVNADRPFTLPPEIAEVDIFGAYDTPKFNAFISANYGVVEDFQINVGYDGVSFVDFETIQAEKAFHLGFDYFFLQTKFFASMLDIDFPLYVDTYVAQNIKLALPTSIPIWRAARVGLMLFNASLVDLTFAPRVSADINLPARIGWQATDGLWVGLGTNLATFHINQPDGNGGTLGNDYIWTKTPIYASALYGFTDVFDAIGRIGFHDVQTNLGNNFYMWFGIGVRFGRMTE